MALARIAPINIAATTVVGNLATSQRAAQPRAAPAGPSTSSLRSLRLTTRRPNSWECSAAAPGGPEPTESTPPSVTPASGISGSSLPDPPPRAKPFNFGEVMAFSGAGPETINGRAAMVGFVAAILAEISSGESVWQQITLHPGATAGFSLVAVLTTLASFVPIYKNLKAEEQAVGPFVPGAEVINGRAAMIGFAALLLAESIRGAALF